MARLHPEGSKTMLVQQWIAGPEYGLDIVNDLNARHVGILARRKLVMRGGSTGSAVSVHEPRLTRLGEFIGQRLAHLGSLDCDIIAGDHNLMVLDLNPRLGGGYPFSHLAGANFWLFSWHGLRGKPMILRGSRPSLAWAPRGTTASELSSGTRQGRRMATPSWREGSTNRRAPDRIS